MSLDINIPVPPRISKSFTQTGHGFVVGNIIYRKSDNTWSKARASSLIPSRAVGYVTAVADANNFTMAMYGFVTTGVPVATAGTVFYLSALTSGTIVSTPEQFHYQVPVLTVIESGASAVLMLGLDTQRIRQWMPGAIASTIAASSTRHCFPWASTGTPQATIALRQQVAPLGTYQHYTINTVGAQSATGSLVVTMTIGGVDQAIGFTIAAGGAAGVYEDTTNIVTNGIGNALMSIKYVNNATVVSTTIAGTNLFYEEV